MGISNISPLILFLRVNPVTFYLYTDGSNMVERETGELLEGKETGKVSLANVFYLTQYTLCKIFHDAYFHLHRNSLTYFTFFSVLSLQIQCVFCSYSTSQFGLGTF